jgi:hypothetical protein
MPTVAQVRRIQFNDEEIGMGFNSESGLAIGSALEGFAVREDASAPGQSVRSSITIVNSHEELMSTLDMSFAAQGRYGFYSGSAKTKFSDSSNYNSTATCLVARCIVQNPLKRGRDYRVKAPAQALLDSNRFDEFRRAFGDSFVRGLQTGGEFYSVVTITSVSETKQSSLAATLQGEANGLLASGSFKAEFASANQDSSTRSKFVATMFQMAGSGASISPVAEIGDVIARFKSFPTIVAAAPVAYEAEVATYDTLPLALPTPEEREDFLLALVDAREKKLRYIQTRNDLEFARNNAMFFEGLPSNDLLLSSSQVYTRLINAVMDHAIKLSRGQMTPPRLFDPSALTPPIAEPDLVPMRRAAVLSANPFAIKGKAIADANPLVAALRATEAEGPLRTGFDIGMGVWLGHTADGAGKQAAGKALTPGEQVGFADAAVFSLQWNNNTTFAAKGAAIAAKDPAVAAARAKARGGPPDGLPAALYWLGFDVATGIFGNPALGAQGNTLIGPGSEKIRATLGPDGRQGFNDSLPFNVVRR